MHIKSYIDNKFTGIPGDGKCLFRSVAHGACLLSGKPAPNEHLQKELADDLRARVCSTSILPIRYIQLLCTSKHRLDLMTTL